MLELLRNEPVRVRVYGITVLVAGYLFARQIITAADVQFYVGLAAIVLGVETSRAKVTPTRKVPTAPTNVANVHIDSEEIIRVIKRRNRENGQGSAGI